MLGFRDFWTIRLKVGPGALIPRPDSETLIEACLDFARHERKEEWTKRILDLGTGPGTLLYAAMSEWTEARGLGVASSETATGYEIGRAHVCTPVTKTQLGSRLL